MQHLRRERQASSRLRAQHFDMEDEDDVPPMLVATDGSTAADVNLSAKLGDFKITRVPITIITGQY